MPQSQKTLEFLQKLKDKGHWNDDYDYSEVEYINSETKIILIDKKIKSRHLISPYNLLIRNTNCTIRNCVNKNEYTISEFRLIHKNQYDYSKFNYTGAKNLALIICKLHGEYKQTPSSHKTGSGCPKCGDLRAANSKLKNQDQIIKSFIEVHGDKYDYSKFVYNGTKTKAKIICKTHGVFEQTPSKHKIGRGCSKCQGRGLSQSEIIKKFKEIHGDKYDYSLVEYQNAGSLVQIICKVHGVFKQIAKAHKQGSGCPICVGNVMPSTSFLIKKFKEIHGDKYDYSHVDYIDSRTSVKIICKEHGAFYQPPSRHRLGAGCSKCSGNSKLNTNIIIKQFKLIHGNKYDYSKVIYKNAHSKVKISCSLHGVFEQSPDGHKRGKGCPTCGIGWNTERVISFINEISNDDILKMDPVELNMLIAQGKLPKEFEELVFTLEGTKENSLKTLKRKIRD